MKFDIVIGNPPYQEEDGGHSRSSEPIYHIFVRLAQELANKYVMMVTPSRWMIGGKGLTDYRAQMINDTRLRLIVDDMSPTSIFDTVTIE